jgi:Lipase (class 3)
MFFVTLICVAALAVVLPNQAWGEAHADKQELNESVLLARESVQAKTVADQLWHYAALAAHVYDLGLKTESEAANLLTSRWLKFELQQPSNEEAKSTYSDWSAVDVLKSSIDDCKQTAVDRPGKVPIHCENAAAIDELLIRLTKNADAQKKTFTNELPKKQEDCDVKNVRPKVPISKAILDYGWAAVPELTYRPIARGWSLFVPDFELEVWRRPLLNPNDQTNNEPSETQYFEYAIAFRGTAGSGGWLSNFRVLTALTPFVWDQYQQSLEVTKELINRIYAVHALADYALKRSPSKIYITTVGHSLGGAMAQHVYLQLPKISKAIAFNSSPFNGASLVKIDDRSTVTSTKDRTHDVRKLPPPFKGSAPIISVFEHGEILSLVHKCVAGPLWGAEGGPFVDCFGVNLSTGGIFKQHSMAQFACKLSLLSRGIATR